MSCSTEDSLESRRRIQENWTPGQFGREIAQNSNFSTSLNPLAKSSKLDSVVARAVETAQPLIEARKHRLEVQLPTEALKLYADSVRLTQILGNLLLNAAKYTEAYGRNSLTAERSNVELLLKVSKVRDTGRGLARSCQAGV
jgi:signal transduction histidine kinase